MLTRILPYQFQTVTIAYRLDPVSQARLWFVEKNGADGPILFESYRNLMGQNGWSIATGLPLAVLSLVGHVEVVFQRPVPQPQTLTEKQILRICKLLDKIVIIRNHIFFGPIVAIGTNINASDDLNSGKEIIRLPITVTLDRTEGRTIVTAMTANYEHVDITRLTPLVNKIIGVILLHDL
jgi:hypothetical protein